MPSPVIRLKTEIPGPQSVALMKRRAAAVPRGLTNNTPLFIRDGHGSALVDVDGNQFLDFAGGIGCLNVGHTPERVVEAIKRQSERFLHSCFHVMPGEVYVALAERMNELVPISGKKKTFFANSGAEGIENAVKCARIHTKRQGVIVFEDAFHGRTLLTMTMTSKVMPYKRGFGPFAPEVYRMPFANCYRCPYGQEFVGCELTCAEEFESFFKRHVDPESVAALVVEPILGEGGFVVPPVEWLQALRCITRERGIVLIADEVQAGIGRTGRLFASERFDLDPDILVSAKSIAGGLPLSAITGRAEIMDAAHVGGLGSTYGGNPVACAAALAALETLERDGLCARAEVIGKHVSDWATALAGSIALIGNVRHAGAMIGIELVTDRQRKTPAKEQAQAIQKYCYEHGLIVLTASTLGNVLRLLMPLVITDGELAEGLEVLGQALKTVGG